MSARLCVVSSQGICCEGDYNGAACTSDCACGGARPTCSNVRCPLATTRHDPRGGLCGYCRSLGIQP
jgi:hypothetical protein